MIHNVTHCFVRLFSTNDGKQVLNHLKTLTKERVLAPDCSEAELRFLEGQRFLVNQIETWIRQGKEQP
ncbi:MAG: hypothetical protein IKY98_00215 [Alphaproteobacteria bacterium]|nr:hypothetical protein [Alphaproteobacteria bacterium]